MEAYAIVSIALMILSFGLVSAYFEKSPVTPAMVFVVLGWLLAPEICSVIHVSPDGEPIRTIAELTLLFILFIDAARIDFGRLRTEAFVPLRLLGIGLPLMILFGAVTAYFLFDRLSIWEAALLATILAPTDAALGEVVVTNPRVPLSIRQSLNIESGLNDGIAFPLVLVFLTLAGASGGAGEFGSVYYWATFLSQQLCMGVLAGIGVGYVGGKVISWASRIESMTKPFEQLSTASLAVLSFFLGEALGGSGFISAYVAGLTVGIVARPICKSLFAFGEGEGRVIGFFIFLIFGATMVWEALDLVQWKMVLYGVLSLTVLRMVTVALSLKSSGLPVKTILFLGWFGPRGLASILFTLLLLPQVALGGRAVIFVVVTVTVLMSVFAHGATALIGAFWFSRRPITARGR